MADSMSIAEVYAAIAAQLAAHPDTQVVVRTAEGTSQTLSAETIRAGAGS